jgi:hypothetical protein
MRWVESLVYAYSRQLIAVIFMHRGIGPSPFAVTVAQAHAVRHSSPNLPVSSSR